MLELLGIIKIVRQMAAAAFAWALRNPAWALCVVLAGVAFLGWSRADHWKARDTKDRAALVQMRAASDANAKAQLAQKAAYEANSRKQAHDADQHLAALAGDYDARLAAYIRADRVRRGQASVSPAGGPTEDHGTQGSDRSGGTSQLVEVTPDDLRICTTNTARLKAVHDWAAGLNSAP